MLKKTITYENYDGEKCTEDFYFNLNRSELIELDAELDGGVVGVLKRVINNKDTKELISFLKVLILRSYGEKTLNGKRFVKTPEMTEAFHQSPAYDELFMNILSDTDSQTTFINGILPQSIVRDAENYDKKQLEGTLADSGVHVTL